MFWKLFTCFSLWWVGVNTVCDISSGCSYTDDSAVSCGDSCYGVIRAFRTHRIETLTMSGMISKFNISLLQLPKIKSITFTNTNNITCENLRQYIEKKVAVTINFVDCNIMMTASSSQTSTRMTTTTTTTKTTRTMARTRGRTTLPIRMTVTRTRTPASTTITRPTTTRTKNATSSTGWISTDIGSTLTGEEYLTSTVDQDRPMCVCPAAADTEKDVESDNVWTVNIVAFVATVAAVLGFGAFGVTLYKLRQLRRSRPRGEEYEMSPIEWSREWTEARRTPIVRPGSTPRSVVGVQTPSGPTARATGEDFEESMLGDFRRLPAPTPKMV